ncbi:MAG: hypothetical protein ACE3L7_04230 [Candidatus Pristimantibacillus sp.]
MLKRLLITTAVLMLLAGCSNGGSGLKEIKASDLCVTHINLDANICYSDDRKKVEVVTGEGEEGFGINYNNGISIMYREDRVAGIVLNDESLGIYKTTIGVELGQLKKEIKEQYGTDITVDGVKTLDFFYDSDKANFINPSLDKKDTAEDMEKVYLHSFSFNEEGLASRIMLLDWRMAMLFN